MKMTRAQKGAFVAVSLWLGLGSATAIETFSYRKPITVDSAQVMGTSDHANFPVLVRIALDADLRTIANGGNVSHPSGFDIFFTASDGATPLDFEIEQYDGLTGTLIAWVRVPVLSYNSDTTIYANYGSAAIDVPQETPCAVWDSGFVGVWHLSENGSGGYNEYEDSSSYGSHGRGGEGDPLFVPTPTAGQIGNGQYFDRIYTTGTSSIGAGSATVTFGGGAFLPTNIQAGDQLMIDRGGANEELFTVASRDSATQLTVSVAAALTHIGETYVVFDHDPKNDVIDVGNRSSLDIVDDRITLQAWIQHDITPEFGRWFGIVNHRGFSQGYRLIFPDNSTQVRFDAPGSVDSLQSAASVPPGSWHHVVATYDGTEMRIYLDGVQDPNTRAKAGNLTSVPPPSNRTWIGHGDQPKDKPWSYPWEGMIDEMRISNVARSADWIATEYNNQSAPGSFYTVGSEEAGSYALPELSLNYRSIGTNPAVLYATGDATISLGSKDVTFGGGASLPANVGVGDELVLDPGGPNEERFFIRSRSSTTAVKVQSKAVLDHSAPEPYSIRRAFITLQSWETAREGNLVLENRREIGVVYNDGPFMASLDVGDSSTDCARFMWLTVAPGERHIGIAGTGAVLNPSADGHAIIVRNDHTRIDWLEVTDWSGDSAEGVRIDADRTFFSHMIVHDAYEAVGSDNADGFYLNAGNGDYTATIRNSFIYNIGRTGIYLRNWTGTNTLVYDLENVTVFNCGSPSAGEVEAAGGISIRETSSNTSRIHAVNVLSVGNFDTDGDGDADFNVDDLGAGVPSWGVSGFNISSDATAPGPMSATGVAPANELSDLTPGNENLHLRAGAIAIDLGTDMPDRFADDIDGTYRGSPWDVGADELGGPASIPTISSNSSQTFTIADPATVADRITITESAAGPSITAADDIRIRIPASFNMIWDPAVATVLLGGTASGSVDIDVKAYEDAGRTVVLDVTADFLAGDQLTVDGLRFFNFVAPSPADALALDIFDDDVPVAFDDKTITIDPASAVSLSSELDQMFVESGPPTPAATLYVSEASSGFISPGWDIRINVPVGFNMVWDSSLTSPMIGGNASAKVNPIVMYENSDQTLHVVVNTAFAPGDFISLSGLGFASFTAISPVDNLELDVVASNDIDDKTIVIDEAADVVTLAATATDSNVLLQWIDPVGRCDFIRILARDDGTFPTGPLDLAARVVDPAHACTGPGLRNSFADAVVSNDTTYHYAVYVDYGSFTPGRNVISRPFNSVPGPVKWAYSTGATSMAPPGLRFDATRSYVYVVSNDSTLHAVYGGDPGGDWPTAWIPFRLGAPAQARPPVVPFAVGGALDGAAFLGSQDGKVYVVDADTGGLVWETSIASMVQAAPAGNFLGFDAAAFDFVFAGTRNSSAPNALEAMDVSFGTPVWGFKNEAAQNGDGKSIGIISGSASVDYLNHLVYFASREQSGGSINSIWCVDFTSDPPQLVWAQSLGNIDGSPTLHNGVVYAGTNAGVVYALDGATGAVNWSRALGDGAVKGFIFPRFGTNEILLSTDTTVWSVRDNGASSSITPNWPVTTIPSPSTPLQVPFMMEVLVGSSDGKLYQLDASNAVPPKSVTLGDGGAALGSPTVDLREMMVYVGTDAGIVHGVTFPLP